MRVKCHNTLSIVILTMVILLFGGEHEGMVAKASRVGEQRNSFIGLAPSQLPCQVKETNTSNPYSNDLEIDRAVQNEMCAQGLFGLAIGLVKDGKIIYLKGYGYEDLEKKIPVESHKTMFRWASLSKSVTAVAAVQAVLAGDLDLDADVRNYVPEYKFPKTYSYPLNNNTFDTRSLPDSPKPLITTRMLLNNTSGIKFYGNSPNNVGIPPTNLINNPEINVNLFWAGEYFWNDPNHLLYIPGTKYSYTSYGYNLAGMVIERAGNRVSKTYWEKVRDQIAVPLGMTPRWFPDHPQKGYLSGTFFQPDYEWVNIPRRAVGYQYDNNAGVYKRSGSDDVSWKLPGGGFISTVENVTQYCNGLINRKDVVSEQMKEDFLWKPARLSDGALARVNDDTVLTNYGMGFGIGSYKGRRIVGHNGSQQKTRSRLVIYPDEGLCFVAMTNSEWANISKLVYLIEDAYRNKKLSLNGR